MSRSSSHTMAGPMLRFRLEDEARALRTEGAGGRDAITLVKDGELRVVLVALPGGTTLDDHTTPGPTTVQVLDGSVRFRAGAAETLLGRGTLVALEPGIEHGVTADEDSTLLLTLIDPRAAG